jgi:hypothetical protein
LAGCRERGCVTLVLAPTACLYASLLWCRVLWWSGVFPSHCHALSWQRGSRIRRYSHGQLVRAPKGTHIPCLPSFLVPTVSPGFDCHAVPVVDPETTHRISDSRAGTRESLARTVMLGWVSEYHSRDSPSFVRWLRFLLDWLLSFRPFQFSQVVSDGNGRPLARPMPLVTPFPGGR